MPILRMGVAAARAALIGSLGLLLVAAPGCGRGAPPDNAPTAAAARGAGSAAKAEDIREDPVKTGIEAGDAGLAGRVRARLAGDPQLHTLTIEVDAEGGGVTLWGHVDRAADRDAVEQVARRTPGVSTVKNLIKVGDAAPPPS